MEIWLFAAIFALTALAGIAAMLRTNQSLTRQKILSALLNSGFVGLGIALIYFETYRDNIYFLVGLCVLAGLGGYTVVDLVLTVVRAKIGDAGEAEPPHLKRKKKEENPK